MLIEASNIECDADRGGDAFSIFEGFRVHRGGGESGSVIGLYLWRYSTQLELLQFLQMAFKGSARKFDFSNPYTRLTFNSFQSHAESHKL